MSQLSSIFSRFLPNSQSPFLKNLSQTGRAKLSQDLHKQNAKLTLLNQVAPKNVQVKSVFDNLSASGFFTDGKNPLANNIKSALTNFLGENSNLNTIKDALSASSFIGSDNIYTAKVKAYADGYVDVRARNVKIDYRNIEVMNEGVKKFVNEETKEKGFWEYSRARAKVTLEYSSKSQMSAEFSQEATTYTKAGKLSASSSLKIEAQTQEKFALITLLRKDYKKSVTDKWLANNSANINVYSDNNTEENYTGFKERTPYFSARNFSYSQTDDNFLITQHRVKHLSKLKDLYKVEGNSFYITDYKDAKGRDVIIYVKEQRSVYDDPVAVGPDLGSMASRQLFILNRDTGEIGRQGFIQKPITTFGSGSILDKTTPYKVIDIPDNVYEAFSKYLITGSKTDENKGISIYNEWRSGFDEWRYNPDTSK